MDRVILDLSQVGSEKTGDRKAPAVASAETPQVSFEDMLSASVRRVNALQLEADDKVRSLAIGDVDDISEVALASSRADMALRLLMELRNKFLDAYQSLSRISG